MPRDLRILDCVGSGLVGRLPRGCRLCIGGAKMVLFVTGVCNQACFYCPISEKRRGKDEVWANEVLVTSDEDILVEAELSGAKGTSITGGEPLLRVERVLGYLDLLKECFGEEHHVHLYTSCKVLVPGVLTKLWEHGLDELRLHPFGREDWGWIGETAKKFGGEMSIGVEIPAIPGQQSYLLDLLHFLESIGVEFLNLNELEFSETNRDALLARGYTPVGGLSMGARNSEELAKAVLRHAQNLEKLTVHYCPSRFKDRIQLRHRLVRRSRRVAKPYEVATDEGLLVKGVVYPASGRLEEVAKVLVVEYGVPPNMVWVDREKGRVETSLEVVEELARVGEAGRRGWDLRIVEEYPTRDRFETLVVPLANKPETVGG